MTAEREPGAELTHSIRTLWPDSVTAEGFVPWRAGEQGQQTFLKFTREAAEVYLFGGRGGVVHADLQRQVMRLTNEGWELAGELQLTFDGTAEPEMEALFGPEQCMLELGASLLPLVDPFQKAPLLEKLRDIRREVARDLGFVAPGVSVRDNLQLDPADYCIRLRGVAVARGQVFLDRLLAMGSQEQLDGLPGWMTTDPVYHLPARWIEFIEQERAEAAGCLLLGALAVMLTHIRQALTSHAPRLLGLQETHTLLMRLRQTHPIVVDEFLSSVGRVRKVRHVLAELLAEEVSIRDLTSILEVLGDNLDTLDDVEASVELARGALAGEILERCTDPSGAVRALLLTDETQERLRREPVPGPLDSDGFVGAVRGELAAHDGARVLFVEGALRRSVRRRLAASCPTLAIFALEAIPPSCRPHIDGHVAWKGAVPERSATAEKTIPVAEESGGFFRPRRKKHE